MLKEQVLALIVEYAFQFVGTPYIWGGNHMLEGVDCSGYVCEIARFGGFLGREDLSAQGLYEHLMKIPHARPGELGRGAFVFYGPSVNDIKHVAFMIDDNRILEAGGGGKKIKTLAEARAAGAMVRGRTLNYRTDRVAVVMPPYDELR